MPWGVLLWVYPVWDPLGFLELGGYFLPHFKEVFNDYLFLKKSKLDNDITWKGHDGITSFMNINVKHKIIANQSNIILKG